MNDRRFGPKEQGERYLAVVLGFGAAGLIYLGAFHFGFYLPPDPRADFTLYTLLIAAVLLIASVAAWRWKRMQSELTVSQEGVRFRSTGLAPIGDTELAWGDIAMIEHRVIMRYRAPDLRYLVFIAGPVAENPDRDYALITNGLEADVPDVMRAIVEDAQDAGWSVIGPRIDHVAAWFNGMNWRLERA